tara:strand:- start:2989 stop:3828 length:840 start_codon:yes stop_codon:yes gene_type:complete
MTKIDDLKLKYGTNDRTANALLKLDETKTLKYLDWLFKMKHIKSVDGVYTLNKNFPSTSYSDVKKMLGWLEFNTNNPKVSSVYKDINSFKTIESFMETIGILMTQPTKKDIKSDVIRLFEDDNFLVIIPKTYESSKIYGMGTKWCTTNKNYFKSYTDNGFLVYVVIKSLNRKLGIPINTKGVRSANLNFKGLIFYNNEDIELRYDDMVRMLGESNLLGKIINPIVKYYNNTISTVIKKQILLDSIKKLKGVKEDMLKSKLFNDDNFDKILGELLETMTK